MSRAVASARQPPVRASEVVATFLRALEARDLPAAAALLAPGAQMKFPGAQPAFASLEGVIAWSRSRYRFVDRFEIDAAGRITSQQVWNDLGEVARG